MSVLADIEGEIRNFLSDAEKVLYGPAIVLPASDAAHLIWLQKVLRCKMGELLGVMADLEAGLSITDIGFPSDDAFEQEVENLKNEILSLKQQIEAKRQTAR